MKKIGILGGMGPAATVDLFNKIVLHTDAKTDQEHIPIIIENNTNIPDRTAAILGNELSPLPEMIASAKRLEAGGADVLAMPCNTAHYFYESIIAAISVPMINMIDATAKKISELGEKKVVVIATTATLELGMYQKALEKYSIEAIIPTGKDVQLMMDLVYKGVKAEKYDFATDDFEMMLQKLLAKGANYIVMGCSELPLAFANFPTLVDYLIIDPTLILAEEAIKFAGGKVR